jgi:NAD(P)-dependent dehydrogenase (short-subunit alcohol dehydrogenase family)
VRSDAVADEDERRGGIDGAVIAVTGAAGGIGAATCSWLAERGARVYALDRRVPSGADPATFLEFDVLDPAGVTAAVGEVVARAGRLDGMVAAAGIAEEPTAAEDMDVAVWDRTIAVNLRGAFLTVQAAGRVMLAQGSGRIVAIASMSGNHVVNTPQQQVAYNASKAGVVAMVKSLAYEWAPRGVRVNALSPGYIDTPLLGDKATMHEGWRAATPLGRFGTPDEVAAAVGFLLSDEASFFAGSELLMDGGYALA